MNFNVAFHPVELARAETMHLGQTEDNEPRVLIESPVPCSGINSNYATWDLRTNLEFMQSFQNLHCPQK